MNPTSLKQLLPAVMQLGKAPLPLPGGAVTAQPRRSFSVAQDAPPLTLPATTGTPQVPRTRESSGAPGMPPVVKLVLGDVSKIDPSAPRETRRKQFGELIARHDAELQVCEDTRTKSGRDEFLAKTTRTALAGLVRESEPHEKVTLNRRAAFARLKEQSPRQAAVYASLVHPSLRLHYGIHVSGKEMAAFGVEDKGPYLSESQLLSLCDYTSGDSGAFHVYRAVDVLKQHLGERGSGPFALHIKDGMQDLQGAVGTLTLHPACIVKGDFYKGIRLDGPFLKDGLESLSTKGLLYPQGIVTSATSDPMRSYVHTHPDRDAEVMFTGGEGLDVAAFHDTSTLGSENQAPGQSEVLLKPGVAYYGTGMGKGYRMDGSVGGEVPYDRYTFAARPVGDNKGPA